MGLGVDHAGNKRRKMSPPSYTNGHLGPRLNKLKVGEVRDGHHRPSWSQQRLQDRPNVESWLGNRRHKAFGERDQAGTTAGKSLIPSAGRRQVYDVANGRKEREEEEELSEMFSQLYESSQASELDQVYFDMKDVISDGVEEREEAEFGRSILVEKESQGSSTSTSEDLTAAGRNHSLTQAQSQTSSRLSLFSQRYLTLSSHPHALPTVHRPRLILCGAAGMGQTSLLSPALLHTMEEFPVKTLDLTTVFATSIKTPEEACTQVSK